MWNDPKLWIMVLSYLGGGVIFWFGVGWTVSQKMASIMDSMDTKVSRVYSRFDQHKEFVDKHFIRHDTCSVRHDNIALVFTDLKAEIKLLRESIDRLHAK